MCISDLFTFDICFSVDYVISFSGHILLSLLPISG
jgi:hypothetical protein